MRMLRQLNQEGSTIVMVTHSPAHADFASRVVNMLDGLAFSALDPDPAAAPGRTAERALRLVAELIVHRYPEQEPR